MKTAPVFIACVADVRCRIKDDREIYLDENCDLPELKHIIRDTAAAIENMLLEAENMGLSSCWTAWFSQEDMRPIMGIPDDKYVVGVVTVGYSDEVREATPRKPLESIIRYEKW